MISDSFYSYLKANAGIATLCPASIFPHVITQDAALPAITFSLDSDGRDMTFDGQGGLSTALFEVNTYDLDHAVAHELADAIESALVNYRGALGSKTAEHVRLERKFDLFEADSKLYRVSQQFLVAYY